MSYNRLEKGNTQIKKLYNIALFDSICKKYSTRYSWCSLVCFLDTFFISIEKPLLFVWINCYIFHCSVTFQPFLCDAWNAPLPLKYSDTRNNMSLYYSMPNTFELKHYNVVDDLERHSIWSKLLFMLGIMDQVAQFILKWALLLNLYLRSYILNIYKLKPFYKMLNHQQVTL